MNSCHSYHVVVGLFGDSDEDAVFGQVIDGVVGQVHQGQLAPR